MDKVLYTAMNGADSILRAQTMNANNLANVNTVGFKADYPVFEDYLVTGDGYPSRVSNITEDKGSKLSAGAIVNTGNDLDIAIDGEGWLAVQAPNGRENYTRRGDLKVDSYGMLTTGNHLPVLGDNGPIAIPPGALVNITREGNINVAVNGKKGSSSMLVGRLKLVKAEPEDLHKNEFGLFETKAQQPLEADANVKVTSRVVEGSNVNAIDAMVSLIELSRSFELQLKLMDSAKQNDEVASSVMQV